MTRNSGRFVLMLALAPVAIVYAADDPPADAATTISADAKAVATTVKRDAKVVAKAAKDGAQQVAEAAKGVAKEVAAASKQGAQDVAAAAKRGAKAAKEGAAKAKVAVVPDKPSQGAASSAEPGHKPAP